MSGGGPLPTEGAASVNDDQVTADEQVIEGELVDDTPGTTVARWQYVTLLPPTWRARWTARLRTRALALQAVRDALVATLRARSAVAGDGPYLALDEAHLSRWRGHALARFGRPDAVTVLRDALDRHDADFARAEAGLRTDLVLACIALGEGDAARHELAAARRVADAVDSTRQRRRLTRAAAALAS